MPRIYDVSVPIRDGGLVYPGNPEIRITLQQSIAAGASSNVSQLTLGAHTGTHVDAGRHLFDDGTGADDIPLEVLMGTASVLEFDASVTEIGASELRPHLLESGVERVLLKTRNSTYLTQDPAFHKDYTYLAPDGAQFLLDRGVRLVGIDYLSIEQFHSGHHQTHRTLLEHGIVIVEGLNLLDIRPGTYDFHCLPLRIVGCDGAPARAVLVGRRG